MDRWTTRVEMETERVRRRTMSKKRTCESSTMKAGGFCGIIEGLEDHDVVLVLFCGRDDDSVVLSSVALGGTSKVIFLRMSFSLSFCL